MNTVPVRHELSKKQMREESLLISLWATEQSQVLQEIQKLLPLGNLKRIPSLWERKYSDGLGLFHDLVKFTISGRDQLVNY